MRQVVEDKMVHLSEKFIRPGTKDFEIGGGEKKKPEIRVCTLKNQLPDYNNLSNILLIIDSFHLSH